MTLYKGPALQIIKGQAATHHDSASTEPSEQHWVLGTVMLIASCGGWASFFILQVSVVYTIAHLHAYSLFSFLFLSCHFKSMAPPKKKKK